MFQKTIQLAGRCSLPFVETLSPGWVHPNTAQLKFEQFSTEIVKKVFVMIQL